MTTEKILNNLRSIDAKLLARTMNVTPNMARKYKQEPWKYDPPTSKSLAVEDAHGIPVSFWKNIKIYVNENIANNSALTKVQ